ncbi:MAG TPA: DsrE family protein [Bacillota bacterium]|nr:DsrE family protein [Bacillota bacterium]
METPDLLITLTAHERDANNVTVAFTMAIKALEKGYQPEIILLSDGVHIAEKGYVDKIDIGSPFKPVSELLSIYLEQGGRLSACGSCMQHNGVKESDLVNGADKIDADYVVDSLMKAEKTLQLN